jgi:hypothetical protein
MICCGCSGLSREKARLLLNEQLKNVHPISLQAPEVRYDNGKLSIKEAPPAPPEIEMYLSCLARNGLVTTNQGPEKVSLTETGRKYFSSVLDLHSGWLGKNEVVVELSLLTAPKRSVGEILEIRTSNSPPVTISNGIGYTKFASFATVKYTTRKDYGPLSATGWPSDPSCNPYPVAEERSLFALVADGDWMILSLRL